MVGQTKAVQAFEKPLVEMVKNAISN